MGPGPVMTSRFSCLELRAFENGGDTDRCGFHHCPDFKGDVIWKVMEKVSRTCHIFCVGTVDANAIGPLLFAGLGEAALTRIAHTTGASTGFGDNPVANLPPLYFFTDISNHSGEFMAQDNRRPVGMSVMIDVKVAPADRDGISPRSGLRHLLPLALGSPGFQPGPFPFHTSQPPSWFPRIVAPSFITCLR